MLLWKFIGGDADIPPLDAMFEQVRLTNGSEEKMNLIVEQVFFC